MNLLSKLEDLLDKISTKVEVSGYSQNKYNTNEFHNLMNKLISDDKFKLRSRDDNNSTYVLNVLGKVVGEISQAKVLFGKEATPEMYRNMKSRFTCQLMENGTIEIRSFEYAFLALQKEQDAFRELLSMRLNILLQMIDDDEDDIVVEETS